MSNQIAALLRDLSPSSVVPFNSSKDAPLFIDLSPDNPALRNSGITVVKGLKEFVNSALLSTKSSIAYGGYLERRQLYGLSEHFSGAEPRDIHLGIDLWLPAGTTIHAPLAATVHSFKNNQNFLDYGPTILLEHQLPDLHFYSLYGHLSLASLNNLEVGMPITAGQKIAELGDESVNGNWPPHLHFQLMIELKDWQGQNWEGDYPGVSEASKISFYKDNCPNPSLIIPWIQSS